MTGISPFAKIVLGIASFFVLAAMGVGVWYLERRGPSAPPPPLPLAPIGTSTAPVVSRVEPSVPAPEKSGATEAKPPIIAVPKYLGRPVGELAADQAVVSKIPAEVYETSKKQLAELAAAIAKNPGDTDLWMQVAGIRHFYHDYLGERDIYEYLNQFAPFLSVPFYNLANLYGYYLKEPHKAIPKYQSALAAEPSNESFYTGFADFYREVLGDLPAAERVLLAGAAKLPTEPNLYLSLATVYRAKGDVPRAVASYERALATGRMAEQQSAAIAAEIARLKELEAK